MTQISSRMRKDKKVFTAVNVPVTIQYSIYKDWAYFHETCTGICTEDFGIRNGNCATRIILKPVHFLQSGWEIQFRLFSCLKDIFTKISGRQWRFYGAPLSPLENNESWILSFLLSDTLKNLALCRRFLYGKRKLLGGDRRKKSFSCCMALTKAMTRKLPEFFF